MLRTHTCGELRPAHIGQTVTLAGWVQTTRHVGKALWVDLRDRYGITQLISEEGKTPENVIKTMLELGREFVVQATGKVVERYSKNPDLPTGEIEIAVEQLEILNASKTPPFKIQDHTDGGDDLRMEYRYLDLRRNIVRKNLELRHAVNRATRQYLDNLGFIDVETPVLIKSTPEGARDFVVPSRMNKGEFYALPQSPQTFKQILMVAGFDRYYQIVKCFRDEDLRADRQPEFTQIDCEMSFITQEDILNTFEGLVKFLFKEVKDVEIPTLPRMTYADAMRLYGSDKPDTRFDMQFVELHTMIQSKEGKEVAKLLTRLSHNINNRSHKSQKALAEGKAILSIFEELGEIQSNWSNLDKVTHFVEDFRDITKRTLKNRNELYEGKLTEVEEWIKELSNERFINFEGSEVILGICAKGCADYTRKQLDELTAWLKRPQIGAKGLVYVRYGQDGSLKSSVDKFYSEEDLKKWAEAMGAEKGDLMLIISGEAGKARKQLNELRLEMGTRLGLRDKNKFSCLWVVDFPMFEHNEEDNRWYAMHHPFTAPKPEDAHFLDSSEFGKIRANAYDMVINGVEIGGGSIRIFQRELQEKALGILGFSPEEARSQFGFLMDAFEFGAPPHGGLAFGFDRLCSILGEADAIRDFIAFPKNNAGRDMMIKSPSTIAQAQLDELGLKVNLK